MPESGIVIFGELSERSEFSEKTIMSDEGLRGCYFFAAAARFLKRSTRPAVSITFSVPV